MRLGPVSLVPVLVISFVAALALSGEPGDVTGDGGVDGADLTCVMALAFDAENGCAADSGQLNGPLDHLLQPPAGSSRRESSYQADGDGTDDWWVIPPHGRATLADVAGPGIIRHVWMTLQTDDPAYLSNVWLEIRWEGSGTPAVRAPLGDFFLLGHDRTEDLSTLPLTVVKAPQHGDAPGRAGFSCWFPMPFRQQAEVVVVNESDLQLERIYFLVDWTELVRDPGPLSYFHAIFSSLHVVPGSAQVSDNYVLIDAAGPGRYVGSLLSIEKIEQIGVV